MNPAEYPSAGRDWEARAFGDMSISPNRRGRVTDYPVNDAASPISVANFNAVGGSTILYAGHFPRFHPSDFRVRTLDAVADDWPIDYQTLEPFYAENDRMMGVSGLAGDPAYPPKESVLPPVPLGKSGRPSPRASTSWAGIGGRRTPPSPLPSTTAAVSASILAPAAAAAHRAPRRARTSPTGRTRCAPASRCAAAAGCGRSPSAATAWRRA